MFLKYRFSDDVPKLKIATTMRTAEGMGWDFGSFFFLRRNFQFLRSVSFRYLSRSYRLDSDRKLNRLMGANLRLVQIGGVTYFYLAAVFFGPFQIWLNVDLNLPCRVCGLLSLDRVIIPIFCCLWRITFCSANLCIHENVRVVRNGGLAYDLAFR